MNRRFTGVMIGIWSGIALVLIGLLVFLISCRGSFHRFNWDFWDHIGNMKTCYDKSFSAADFKNINLKSYSADITFSKAQDENIRVTIESNSTDSFDDLFEVSSDASELSISQKNRNWGFFVFGGFRNRINIALPESYKNDLGIRSTSGDIRFNGDYKFGKADINKTSGDITGDSVASDDFSLVSTSGDIDLSSLNAHYNIKSTSGNLKFGELAGYGDVKTTSGNFECKITALAGTFSYGAISGDARIGLSKSVSAKISANTLSGNVNADFPSQYGGRHDHDFSATIGSGPCNDINANTTSGNITFTQD